MTQYRCVKTIVFSSVMLCTVLSIAQQKAIIGSHEDMVYPFKVENSAFYLEDWIRLRKDFSYIEIFGMGDATHGTKEFFNIKAETFKYLVSNHNYRTIGIEASYGKCNFINDYLLSGTESIDSVMQHFDFWIWRTHEIKELILWIKSYNLNKKNIDKITFYGYDMQNFYSPLKYIDEYLRNDTSMTAADYNKIVHPVLKDTEYHIYINRKGKNPGFQDTLFSIHHSLQHWLSDNRCYLETIHPAKEFEKIRFCIENFGQAVTMWSRYDKEDDYRFRDSCMAYNILRIKKMEFSPIFIWAHNSHIGVISPDQKNEAPSMGYWLKEALGNRYYATGFVFNKGTFLAIKEPGLYTRYFRKNKLYAGVEECFLPAYKKNHLAILFAGTNQDSFFIDLISSGNPAFSTQQLTYMTGAVFYPGKRWALRKMIPRKQFDGLVYINKTTPATPVWISR